jgi:hypothetical protein
MWAKSLSLNASNPYLLIWLHLASVQALNVIPLAGLLPSWICCPAN